MLKIIKVMFVATIAGLLLWVIYTPLTSENFISKAIILGLFVTVLAPIMTFYVKAKMKYKSKQQESKGKVVKKQIDLQQYQAIKEVYNKERKHLYLEARDLFKDNMKNGMMSKMDILELKNKIDSCLGEYAEEYKDYSKVAKVKQKDGSEKEVIKKGFDNTAHEIYVKLMNFHITPNEWQEIISYLKSFEGIKEEIVTQ